MQIDPSSPWTQLVFALRTPAPRASAPAAPPPASPPSRRGEVTFPTGK